MFENENGAADLVPTQQGSTQHSEFAEVVRKLTGDSVVSEIQVR